MTTARRFLFRVSEVLDYRTFIVAGAFAVLLLVGYLMIGAVQSAHDANVAANQRGKASARQIDQLMQAGQRKDAQIRSLVASDARQQTALNALTEQIRRMGGQPVIVLQQNSPSPAPSASPRASARPSSRPSVRPSNSPRPSPSASPTCRPLPIVGCPGRVR